MTLQSDDLCDLLSELGHDLGKYLLRPLVWLPADADEAAVQAATRQALDETLRGPRGVRAAATLWRGFLDEVGDALEGYSGWSTLQAAVITALAWRDRLGGPLDRAVLQRDFAAVGAAARALLDEVHDA